MHKFVEIARSNKMKMKVLVLFVATVLVAYECHGSDYQKFPLQMKTGFGGQYSNEVACASWRLGVEANNVVKWQTVPAACGEYIADYVLGDQYRSDSKTVNQQAYFYAKTLNITAKTAWVFDIDETTLSNLPYYADHGFGYDFLLFVYVIVSYLLTVNYINFLRFKEIIPVRLSSFFDTPTHFS